MQLHDYLLIAYLIVAFVWDVKWYKIPNWLTMGAVATGLVYHLIVGGIDGLIFSGLGMLAGGGLLLLLYFFKAVAGGDVKLFAGIGALVGVEHALYDMMYAIVYAGIIGIVLLLFSRKIMLRVVNAFMQVFMKWLARDFKALEFSVGKTTRFPFMYAVLPGVATTYWFTL
ncbi:A24 family peptidase [Numidum massiliense]|uniref:A24 family peptidase n=1 Tax=Numidum massiliense TaxID=1522315 RepID=UPI0006D5B4A0|nr:A24 family peptidase [Numidum massiliense]